MIENSCVCSKVPAETSYRSNPKLCVIPHLINRKDKSFNETVFLWKY